MISLGGKGIGKQKDDQKKKINFPECILNTLLETDSDIVY